MDAVIAAVEPKAVLEFQGADEQYLVVAFDVDRQRTGHATSRLWTCTTKDEVKQVIGGLYFAPSGVALWSSQVPPHVVLGIGQFITDGRPVSLRLSRFGIS